MKCAKCSADMEKTTIAGQEIDRCTSCKGIWLDLAEHTELKGRAREFDIGDGNIGSQFNKIDRINCPVCANTPLTRMVDNDQPHIWFESCSSCGGRFFDAGEFRDISESTLMDWLKKFTAQERK
jgi:uncharacterized protein